jgi:hypothetical protein
MIPQLLPNRPTKLYIVTLLCCFQLIQAIYKFYGFWLPLWYLQILLPTNYLVLNHCFPEILATHLDKSLNHQSFQTVEFHNGTRNVFWTHQSKLLQESLILVLFSNRPILSTYHNFVAQDWPSFNIMWSLW